MDSFSDAPSLRVLTKDCGQPYPSWHWRNCRSIGLSFSIWPLDWRFKAERSDDVYGGSAYLSVGPLTVEVSYSIGGPDHLWGLCDTQAFDRACAYESNRKDGSSPKNTEVRDV